VAEMLEYVSVFISNCDFQKYILRIGFLVL
jgi:hypothetical protein